MKHLKIMVKKTKEERRALTREEYFAYNLVYKHTPPLNSAREYLDDILYINGSFNGDGEEYGAGIFRTETIREATPEEEDAWWLLRRANGIEEAALTYAIDIKGHIALDAVTVGSAKQLLAGKEIIPELVEE